uniref:Uncharacterized protein n=1 Tax=Chromera velia CCMP2878 TaxID=1169474 RepID=A0A0G4HVS2_9ALVE|eukprot:Cvel_8904.t1-p1 / transcript=Cvel_8904.t1 / gene=Cvel_8904 / organism=Chromera_velia_CCMP2878 / gene_product=hypothetical protein / transcript_product=hypothetical protein / location=Cvel_scaffold501:44611-47499(-) / protein_length=897 / sequence_SO=supercontig / SO=protein_coding / is_pseudo=false
MSRMATRRRGETKKETFLETENQEEFLEQQKSLKAVIKKESKKNTTTVKQEGEGGESRMAKSSVRVDDEEERHVFTSSILKKYAGYSEVGSNGRFVSLVLEGKQGPEQGVKSIDSVEFKKMTREEKEYGIFLLRSSDQEKKSDPHFLCPSHTCFHSHGEHGRFFVKIWQWTDKGFGLYSDWAEGRDRVNGFVPCATCAWKGMYRHKWPEGYYPPTPEQEAAWEAADLRAKKERKADLEKRKARGMTSTSAGGRSKVTGRPFDRSIYVPKKGLHIFTDREGNILAVFEENVQTTGSLSTSADAALLQVMNAAVVPAGAPNVRTEASPPAATAPTVDIPLSQPILISHPFMGDGHDDREGAEGGVEGVKVEDADASVSNLNEGARGGEWGSAEDLWKDRDEDDGHARVMTPHSIQSGDGGACALSSGDGGAFAALSADVSRRFPSSSLPLLRSSSPLQIPSRSRNFEFCNDIPAGSCSDDATESDDDSDDNSEDGGAGYEYLAPNSMVERGVNSNSNPSLFQQFFVADSGCQQCGKYRELVWAQENTIVRRFPVACDCHAEVEGGEGEMKEDEPPLPPCLVGQDEAVQTHTDSDHQEGGQPDHDHYQEQQHVEDPFSQQQQQQQEKDLETEFNELVGQNPEGWVGNSGSQLAPPAPVFVFGSDAHTNTAAGATVDSYGQRPLTPMGSHQEQQQQQSDDTLFLSGDVGMNSAEGGEGFGNGFMGGDGSLLSPLPQHNKFPSLCPSRGVSGEGTGFPFDRQSFPFINNPFAQTSVSPPPSPFGLRLGGCLLDAPALSREFSVDRDRRRPLAREVSYINHIESLRESPPPPLEVPLDGIDPRGTKRGRSEEGGDLLEGLLKRARFGVQDECEGDGGMKTGFGLDHQSFLGLGGSGGEFGGDF